MPNEEIHPELLRMLEPPVVDWDEGAGCLVDYMGYPLSRTKVMQLRERVNKHLKKSAADLAGVALEHTKERYPSQIDQYSFNPERFK